MSKKVLNNLFAKLQLTVGQSVFLLKENREELFSIISKETFKKLEIINPDGIYIFNNQPYILFFDLTKKENQERISEIHKQVWSFDQAPLVIFARDNSEEYYNAFDFDKKTGKLSEILDKKTAEKKCSFWNLQSGETLDWFYTKYKKSIRQKRVNQQLFDNIKQTIFLLKDKFYLEESLAKILILRLIFIRYLIDRKIRIDNKFIEGNEDDVIARRKSLSKLIDDPTKLASFFNYLNERFNGVLFKQSNIELTSNQASLLSKLFNPDGVSEEEIINLFSGFDFQYEVFDFGIIPVELISGIYETLLDEDTKNATSAIYTPPFLVDYILTETVDKFFEKNKSTSHCKIFDPAMGSGIFLVQGLRRMIERELEINPNPDNIIFGNNIREIAEKNLFGIDINQEAIDVACFSIYVALLDYQEPGDIDVYYFPNLRDNNFFKVHFFDLSKVNILDKIKEQRVDFILGNPPWKNNSSPEHLDWLKQTKFDKIVSDKQIAQSYLIRVKDFVQNDTKIALIVTSKVFYNNQAQKFKRYFLQNNLLTEVFDLSSVRHIVFENADNPGAIVFFKFQPFKKDCLFDNLIKHISLKQNKFFNKFSKSLIVEKFDVKEIQQVHFINHKWLFKVALYGNTLDYGFLKKFNNQKKIGSFFDANKILFSKGIFRGTPKKHFTDLVGLPILKRKQFCQVYTPYRDDFDIISFDKSFLEAGRTIELFKGKKIILQKSVSVDFKFSIIDFDNAFDSTVYGINFKDDDTFMEVFVCLLMSDFYLYFQYLTSSSWGVYIPELYKEEHINFPFIEPTKEQKEKLISLVENFLNEYKEHYKNSPELIYQAKPNELVLKQINSVVEEIYNIKGYEKDLIDYVLNVSRYQFQDSKQKLVSDFGSGIRDKKYVLESYAGIYIEEFEKIYDESFFKIEIYELDHFIAMNFILLDENPSGSQIELVKEITSESELFKKISTLSISKIASNTNSEFNLFIQKDIKGFEENSFYVIKPKEYKCWHKAMAWYDVAEFKEAIQKAELERIQIKNE